MSKAELFKMIADFRALSDKNSVNPESLGFLLLKIAEVCTSALPGSEPDDNPNPDSCECESLQEEDIASLFE